MFSQGITMSEHGLKQEKKFLPTPGTTIAFTFPVQ
jgi:hypothetical protein